MNDPGLDEPIKKDAKTVEHQKDNDSGIDASDADDAEDEKAYLAPSRWWFASTAFPLIAGTFGPMASAFNVCAIASSWRMNVIPPQTQDNGDEVPDPKWLLGINGVSLAIAIIANLSLLFNMARRIPFSIAQPITIVGWYTSGFILIGLVASVDAPSMQLPESDNVYLSQAYYYACLAAGLYLVVASLMVVTVIGAFRGHYSKDFQLTMSQRTLMLQTIAYLVYLLSGGAAFARIESWSFLDGVWWANYTLLTIGIGDFSPTTHTGQGLLFPFAIGGIVILGLVVGSIRSLVLERGEKKISARIVEKKREKLVDDMHKTDDEQTVRLGAFSHKVKINHDTDQEYHRRAEEFGLMRKIQRYADVRKKWTALLISLTVWLMLWFVGAAVFWVAERYAQPVTYFEMVYFAYTSLLTIGYGDYTMVSNAGKPIFVFWSLLAIPTLTILISNMGDTVVKGIRDLTLWFGELTILPGEGSTTQRLKEGVSALKDGGVQQHIKHHHHHRDDPEDPVEEAPGGVFLATDKRKSGGREKAVKGPVSAATERLGKDYEAEELDAATLAQQGGDKLSHDVHLYHYLLVREIRNVMKDVNESPPRKYSYHEWAWFMRLLGEDENDPKYHKKPNPADKPKENDQGHFQQASHDIDPKSGGESSAWSWMGINSPLLGMEEEAEWVLERLSEKLEDELKLQNDRKRRGEREQEPPVIAGSRKEQQAPKIDGEEDADSTGH